MQRYDSGNEIDPECYPCSDGEWVKYEDAEPFITLVNTLSKLNDPDHGIVVKQLSLRARKLVGEDN